MESRSERWRRTLECGHHRRGESHFYKTGTSSVSAHIVSALLVCLRIIQKNSCQLLQSSSGSNRP